MGISFYLVRKGYRSNRRWGDSRIVALFWALRGKSFETNFRERLEDGNQ